MQHRKPRIIALGGTLRADSKNKKLARNVAAGAESAGADGRLQNKFDLRRAEATGRRLVKMIKRFNDFD